MTLRLRLTLWYGAVLVLCMLLAVYPSYEEIVLEAADHPLPQGNDVEVFHEIFWHMVSFSIPSIFLGLCGGWWITQRLLKPLENVANAAERMSEKTLSERLPAEKQDTEIARLVEVFNAMLARLEASFSRVREFTLHASHELKTPLAILRCSMEDSLRGGANLDPEQRTQIASQLDEIERLARMVDDLGTLTKADAGQLTLAVQPLDFAELVNELADDAEQLARPKSIHVTLKSCGKASVTGDRHRLRQVLLILADNAIKYNHPGGTVAMTLSQGNGQVRFIITNTGTGLATDLNTRVFDRFYRGQEHTGQIEGSGLGLSIAQWIVSAHSGHLQFHSAPDQLTTVTVTLPLLETA